MPTNHQYEFVEQKHPSIKINRRGQFQISEPLDVHRLVSNGTSEHVCTVMGTLNIIPHSIYERSEDRYSLDAVVVSSNGLFYKVTLQIGCRSIRNKVETGGATPLEKLWHAHGLAGMFLTFALHMNLSDVMGSAGDDDIYEVVWSMFTEYCRDTEIMLNARTTLTLWSTMMRNNIYIHCIERVETVNAPTFQNTITRVFLPAHKAPRISPEDAEHLWDCPIPVVNQLVDGLRSN